MYDKSTPTRRCSAPACDRAHYGRGYCQMHLRRLQKHGTIHPSVETDETRFWAKVQKSDGCWDWQGASNAGRRGRAWYRGRLDYAYRVSWALANGPIPDGMLVCHRCDNPACVRPDHLFLGTSRDNVTDMLAKGRAGHRGLPGALHPQAKLTLAQVQEIRQRYAAGEAGTYATVAHEYGVHPSSISNIVRGKTWTEDDADVAVAS